MTTSNAGGVGSIANPRRASSVHHLQELYSVVVAIALTLALERLFVARGNAVTFHVAQLPLLVALVATLIPFYHGALRHLDDLYVDVTRPGAPEYAVLVDFLLLFLESCAFLAMAASIRAPSYYFASFAVLLILDIAWAIVTTFLFFPHERLPAQRWWLLINTATILIMGILAAAVSVSGFHPQWLWTVLALTLAIGRTSFDYSKSWSYYAGRTL